MELAIYEIAFIESPIELKLALARLGAIDKISSVFDSSVVPGLSSNSVLQVLLPLALVHAPLGIEEDSLAVSLAILPFPMVDIPIRMSKPSLSVEFAILCQSLID